MHYVMRLENGNLIEFGAIPDLAIGSKCTIGVRPEKVEISATRSGNACMKGTVCLVTYAGGVTQYEIQALGKEWIIQSQNSSVHGAIFAVGDEIWFGWHAENSLVL